MKKVTFVKSFMLCALGATVLLSSCKKKDDPAPVTIYTENPVGTTTILSSGTIVSQNGPATSGDVEILKDANNSEFIHLKSNFVSGFSTGTVVVYLAKATTKIGDQRAISASNVKAVGFVSANGERYLKINGSSAGYGNVVFYCETAEVNFGASTLN
jgi:Electron transfer DM13